MGQTTIAWTQRTWNPVRGCSMAKGSETTECLNCYAARMAARDLPGHRSPTTGEPFAIMRPSGPRWTGKVELIPHMLDVPLKRRKPTTWFVNSMSDLFHESLPFESIDEVFSVMGGNRKHTFQVLTKRPEIMRKYIGRFKPDGRGWVTPGGLDAELTHCPVDANRWPMPNVWLGTSVGVRSTLHRIDELRETPAAVRFLSLEPLLEDLGTLDLRGINWVIAGGESGPGARPCDIAWIRSIVKQCTAAKVPAFVKQLGARPIKTVPDFDGGVRIPVRLKDRKGGDPEEWSADLRVQQFPAVAR